MTTNSGDNDDSLMKTSLNNEETPSKKKRNKDQTKKSSLAEALLHLVYECGYDIILNEDAHSRLKRTSNQAQPRTGRVSAAGLDALTSTLELNLKNIIQTTCQIARRNTARFGTSSQSTILTMGDLETALQLHRIPKPNMRDSTPGFVTMKKPYIHDDRQTLENTHGEVAVKHGGHPLWGGDSTGYVRIDETAANELNSQTDSLLGSLGDVQHQMHPNSGKLNFSWLALEGIPISSCKPFGEQTEYIPGFTEDGDISSDVPSLNGHKAVEYTAWHDKVGSRHEVLDSVYHIRQTLRNLWLCDTSNKVLKEAEHKKLHEALILLKSSPNIAENHMVDLISAITSDLAHYYGILDGTVVSAKIQKQKVNNTIGMATEGILLAIEALTTEVPSTIFILSVLPILEMVLLHSRTGGTTQQKLIKMGRKLRTHASQILGLLFANNRSGDDSDLEKKMVGIGLIKKFNSILSNNSSEIPAIIGAVIGLKAFEANDMSLYVLVSHSQRIHELTELINTSKRGKDAQESNSNSFHLQQKFLVSLKEVYIDAVIHGINSVEHITRALLFEEIERTIDLFKEEISSGLLDKSMMNATI